jgi:hypothetical protein
MPDVGLLELDLLPVFGAVVLRGTGRVVTVRCAGGTVVALVLFVVFRETDRVVVKLPAAFCEIAASGRLTACCNAGSWVANRSEVMMAPLLTARCDVVANLLLADVGGAVVVVAFSLKPVAKRLFVLCEVVSDKLDVLGVGTAWYNVTAGLLLASGIYVGDVPALLEGWPE